jgi:1-acyl-sn-glycerol-3-phosphate acyltransferase
MTTRKDSRRARVLQAIGIVLFRPLARFLYRVQVRYRAPLPSPPFVLAANHRSFLDPPILGILMASPLAYFARADLWRVPIIAQTLRIMHGIPVDRANPGLSSMRGAVERLRQGISVLVFPEGTRTRNGRLGTLRAGPVLFARRADVPLIPVYIYRSERAWPRGAILPRIGGARVVVTFGPPLRAPEHIPEREREAWLMTRLHVWLHREERRRLGPCEGATTATIRRAL